MNYKENWGETQKLFTAWWKGAKIGRPLMKVIARRNKPLEGQKQVNKPMTPEEMHLGVQYKIAGLRNFCRNHMYIAEAYPNLDIMTEDEAFRLICRAKERWN